MASVPRRKDRLRSVAAVSLWVLRVPTVGPAALPLGREEFHCLLGGKVDRDLRDAKHSLLMRNTMRQIDYQGLNEARLAYRVPPLTACGQILALGRTSGADETRSFR